MQIWKATSRLVCVCIACLSSSIVTAASFDLHGAFTTDDTVQKFEVQLLAAGTFQATTLSFGGGALADGTVVPPGGFEPVLAIFDASAGDLLALDATGGTVPNACGPRAIDPGSGLCLDASLVLHLPAGNYLVTLSEYDNVPLGPRFENGFFRAGQGNFTGPEFLGQPGSFVLFDGSQRTANWALEMSAESVRTAVPEPGGLSLAVGIVLCLWSARHQVKRRT